MESFKISPRSNSGDYLVAALQTNFRLIVFDQAFQVRGVPLAASNHRRNALKLGSGAGGRAVEQTC